MTHCYMEIGDGWAYPGRHLEPSKRLLEHLINGSGIFDPAIRKVGQSRGLETTRRRCTGVFDPAIREKAYAATRGVSSHGYKGRHTRWHTNREIVDPACKLCVYGES